MFICKEYRQCFTNIICVVKLQTSNILLVITTLKYLVVVLLWLAQIHTHKFSPHLEGLWSGECWSSAVILVRRSTWPVEWGPSGASWIISAEASWLGLAGALVMWYHSEPGPKCVCAAMWVLLSVSPRVHGFFVCVTLCLYACIFPRVCCAPVCSLQPVDLSHFARAGGTGGCQAAPGAWVQCG